MAVAFRAQGALNIVFDSGGNTPTLPTNQAGDYLLAIVVVSLGTLNALSGWTQHSEVALSGGNLYLVGAPQSMGAPTFTFSGDGASAVAVASYSGVNASSPVSGTNTATGDGTAITAPSATASYDGSLMVVAAASTATTTYTSSALTERLDSSGVWVGDTAVDTGSTGTKAITASISGSWGAISLVLSPTPSLPRELLVVTSQPIAVMEV